MTYASLWSIPDLPTIDSLWTTDGKDTQRVFQIINDRHGWRISVVNESGPKRLISEWPADTWPLRFTPKEQHQ